MFWLLWIFVAEHGLSFFSSCGEWVLLFIVVQHVFYCNGFSYCGALALSPRASGVAARGLSKLQLAGSQGQAQ